MSAGHGTPTIHLLMVYCESELSMVPKSEA